MSGIHRSQIERAELQVLHYMNSYEFSKCSNWWKKHVRLNSTRYKAVRMAGYLTGTGIIKS